MVVFAGGPSGHRHGDDGEVRGPAPRLARTRSSCAGPGEPVVRAGGRAQGEAAAGAAQHPHTPPAAAQRRRHHGENCHQLGQGGGRLV